MKGSAFVVSLVFGLLVGAVTVNSFSIVFLKVPPTCPEPTNDTLILLPNPDDCSSFYSCNGNEAILQYCQPGLWFNPEVSVCDYPENIEEGICIPPVEQTTSYSTYPTTESWETTEGITAEVTTPGPDETDFPTAETEITTEDGITSIVNNNIKK